MTPSPCANCGKTVMSYRRYFWYFRPTGTCQECGAEMEMRGWRGMLLIGVLLLGVFVATLLVTEEMMTFFTVGIGVAIVGIAIDRWSWLVVPWDPVGEAVVASVAPDATSQPPADEAER